MVAVGSDFNRGTAHPDLDDYWMVAEPLDLVGAQCGPTLVEAAALVLNERMPATDHLGAADPLQPSHRTSPGLQPAMIGFNRVVGVLLHHVTRLGHEPVEHTRVRRRPVDGHLGRPLRRVQGPGEDRRVAARSRFGEARTLMTPRSARCRGSLGRRHGSADLPVASRSRDGSITADELSGGTFTITNTGSRGALFDTPILNAPESAILGLGAAVRRPASWLTWRAKSGSPSARWPTSR